MKKFITTVLLAVFTVYIMSSCATTTNVATNTKQQEEVQVALGPNEYRVNTGSDIIHKVLSEFTGGKIVLEVDTEFYDPDWKATEESVYNSIFRLRVLARTHKDEWDGWYNCWAVINNNDPSKNSPSYKFPEMNKCVDAENGHAFDLIFDMIAPRDIEEAKKLLNAGYCVVNILIIDTVNYSEDTVIGALRMYNNGIWVGIRAY